MEESKIVLENFNWFTAAGIAAFALSEIIALNPRWKSNSVVQIVLAIVARIFKK